MLTLSQTINLWVNFIGRLFENLADMQSLSKYNNGIKYLLCAIYIFSKFAWVVPLKFKREITTVNAFQKIISEGRKPNKIWVDQGGEF